MGCAVIAVGAWKSQYQTNDPGFRLRPAFAVSVIPTPRSFDRKVSGRGRSPGAIQPANLCG